ncbi:MAG: radical SAM protein, partial [Thermoplasmata archaeon]
FPDRKLVDKYNYGFLFGSKLGKGKFTSIITSRGCPYRCRFCQRNFFAMNCFRMRSAENVLQELKLLNDSFDSVLFADDNFLVNRKRAERILEGIINEGLDMELWAEARVSDINEGILTKMKKAGFKVISFGLESGNQDVLDFYRKGITIDQIRKAVTLSRKFGFYTSGTFILGAPIEDEKHFRRTIDFAKSIPLDVTAFFVLEYGAGSPLWEEAVREGKIREDEYLVLADSSRGLSKFSKEEIDFFCRKGHKEFYTRPSYLLDQFIQALRRRDLRLLKAIARLALNRDIRKRYWSS